MSSLAALSEHVKLLSATASHVFEESFRLTVEGTSLDASQSAAIEEIFKSCTQLNVDSPVLRIDNQSSNISELPDNLGYQWRLIIGKSGLAASLKLREDEQTLLFFLMDQFCTWSEQLLPFDRQSNLEPDFSRPVTIRVHGLDNGFGGPSLWIVPVDAPAAHSSQECDLPDDATVHKLVHLISPVQPMQLSPCGWILNWGDLTASHVRPWLRLSCLVMSGCIVNELKRTDSAISVTVRGAKSHTLGLWQSYSELPWRSLQSSLMSAVAWVYAERSETRLKLLIDRLSVDLEPTECWLANLHRHLRAALKQAQDSYAFVILDRKDAYFKEMREVMKDMKSQADLYATKVRELVSSLTRDILGVLVFIGFSFIGKFDQKNLDGLLLSGELSLLLKFLAGYLLLSCVLQLVTHWRDAELAYEEGKNWLGVLQNYTSQQEHENRFLTPLRKRRSTLFYAMAISAMLYVLLIAMVWNLPFIAKLLLVQ